MGDRSIGLSTPVRRAPVVLTATSLTLLGYWLSRSNYLLFHILAESIPILVLMGSFVLAWSVRKAPGNDYLVIVGNTGLAVSLLLFVHAVAYKGMSVLPGVEGANQATQLWLASRYVLAGGLLSAPLWLGRRPRAAGLLAAAGVVVAAAFILAILYVPGLPAAYVEGEGLTAFKVASEYLVVAALLMAGYLMWRKRDRLGEPTAAYMAWSIGFFVVAELSFTLYVDVYGFTNFLGHAFQIVAVVLIYRAYIVVAIHEPVGFALRDLALERDGLALANEGFQRVLDDLPLPVQSLNETGDIVFVNNAWTTLVGYSIEEVAGRNFGELLVPAQRGRFPLRFATFVEVGEAHDVHWDMVAKDGSRIATTFEGRMTSDRSGATKRSVCVIVSATRLDSEEVAEPLFETAAVRDQQHARELENLNVQLRQANNIKSAFLANMSHELRTPLNAVIGFTGVLLQGMAGDINDEQRRQLEMVRDSGDHLLEIVNDILDISKIDAGAVALDLQVADLNQICVDAVETVRPLAAEKGLSIDFQDCGRMCGMRGQALVDSVKVRQILLNLLGNAVKFTQTGSITVRLDCDAHELAVLRVIDTGEGLEESVFRSIFDEFEQAAANRAGKPKGTGLGLAISRRLARLMGGDIMVESVVGEGSTFSLVLPLVVEESADMTVPDV